MPAVTIRQGQGVIVGQQLIKLLSTGRGMATLHVSPAPADAPIFIVERDGSKRLLGQRTEAPAKGPLELAFDELQAALKFAGSPRLDLVVVEAGKSMSITEFLRQQRT